MLRADFVPDGGQVQQDPGQSNNFFAPGQPGNPGLNQPQQFGIPIVNTSLGQSHPGATGQRYYTIQRVNGNGGNGKGDGVPGPHKHGLIESDRVKKNSVQRYIMKRDKEEKKTQVRAFHLSTFHFSLLAASTGRPLWFNIRFHLGLLNSGLSSLQSIFPCLVQRTEATSWLLPRWFILLLCLMRSSALP
jgi:hypothetical protein